MTQEIVSATNVTPIMKTLPVSANPFSLLETAVERGAGIEVIERLSALAERWEANEARKDFEEAMACAKGKIKPIFRNRTVDFTGSTGKRTNYDHEDLAQIATQIDPILAEYGLSYRWRTSSNINEPVMVTCIVTHRRGHFELTGLSAARDDTGNKNSIQQVGSTVTFLQRYTLKAALGLAVTKDTDGRVPVAEDGPINEEQLDKLRGAIVQAGADIARFCAIFKIQKVEELPARHLNEALRRLAGFAKKAAP